MKVLRGVALVAGAAALIATGLGAFGVAAIGSTAGVAGSGVAWTTVASTASIIAAASSVGSQLLAKKPGIQGSVNQVTIGANSPIPYGMGRSFYAGSQLHEEGYGGSVGKTENPYLSKVNVWSAGGPIEDIGDFLMDWQVVGFTGGSALGYYATWLYTDSQLGARPEADALAPPWSGFPDWSSSHKISGMAADLTSFRFDRKGKVWANSIPTWGRVGKWARVYDWRRDDTFPGGDGDHRFADEDSFEWDRNVALNAITYARGRYALDGDGEQTVRVVGLGYPQESIDWPAWNAFANVCDANGWKVNGHVFEGPGISLWDNLKRICAAGGATPLHSGGLLSVRFPSPKVAIDTVTFEDFADGERVFPKTRTWRDRINIMVPKYRSEANKWEFVQSEAVEIADLITLDGEPKEEEFTIELCTDADQAAQVTGYELYDRRELAGITVPCKPRLWGYRLGEALQVTDVEADFDALCVIDAVAKELAGPTTTLTFTTETTAKHALALALTGTAPPPPTLVDPGAADDAAWQNGGNADQPIATDLNATGNVGEADLTWRNPDIAGWAYLKIHHRTTNVFTGATIEATEIVGGLAEVMTATITGLSAGTHYLWVVAYDINDVAFTESASDSAVVT